MFALAGGGVLDPQSSIRKETSIRKENDTTPFHLPRVDNRLHLVLSLSQFAFLQTLLRTLRTLEILARQVDYGTRFAALHSSSLDFWNKVSFIYVQALLFVFTTPWNMPFLAIQTFSAMLPKLFISSLVHCPALTGLSPL
jgi:hypothetical protein